MRRKLNMQTVFLHFIIFLIMAARWENNTTNANKTLNTEDKESLTNLIAVYQISSLGVQFDQNITINLPL